MSIKITEISMIIFVEVSDNVKTSHNVVNNDKVYKQPTNGVLQRVNS